MASKKVKSVRKYNRYFKSFSFSNTQEVAQEEHLESHIELDDQGNAVLEEKYDSTGELEEKNSFIFNKDGKLLEHTLLYAVDDVTEKRTLKRDDKGRLTEETKFYGDDSGEKTTYAYDDKDNLTERTYYDEEGVFSSREEFKFDEKGSLSEQLKFDVNNKLEGRSTFSQNEDKSIEQCEYDAAGKLQNRTVIKFNEAGKELSSAQTTPEGKLISGIDTVYDDKGNAIERHYKDFYSKTVRSQYDENNRCITQELFDGNGTLLRKNMFEYDEEGNVIHEATYEMDTSRGGRDKHFETRYEYEWYG